MSGSVNLNRYLSYYDKTIDFHFCRLDEIDLLETFIDDHWKHGHALAKSRNLMDWQHLDSGHKCYNFILAKERSNGDLLAIQGFITTRQFDPEIAAPALCGAIWKSICEDRYPGIGIILQELMIQQVPHQVLFGLGMSRITEHMNRSKHHQLGLLHQYYILNPDRTCFHLIDRAPKTRHNRVPTETEKIFALMDETAFREQADRLSSKIPTFKSKLYYINRYYQHPTYHYSATAIYDERCTLSAIFFWRKCCHQDACCIRIVDYIGDSSEISGCQVLFEKLLRQENAEFIDFFQVGLEQKNLLSAGFQDRNDSDIVLANYFEPFVLQNVDLNYAWNGPMTPLLYKGDADMDRPNIIEVR